MNSPTPPLLRLPNEILLMILSDHYVRKRTIHRLAQTCRSLHGIALTALYGPDVVINFRGRMRSKYIPPFPPETPIIHTLVNRPELAHVATHLHLRYVEACMESPEGKTHRKLLALAAKGGAFKYIRHLTIELIIPDQWDDGLRRDRDAMSEAESDYEEYDEMFHGDGTDMGLCMQDLFTAIGDLPKLETLAILWEGTVAVGDPESEVVADNRPLAAFLSRHKTLRRLVMHGVGSLEGMVEHWTKEHGGQLEELEITNGMRVVFDQMGGLLRHLPNLISYRLDTLEPDGDYDEEDEEDVATSRYAPDMTFKQWNSILDALPKTKQFQSLSIPFVAVDTELNALGKSFIKRLPNLMNLEIGEFLPDSKITAEQLADALRGHPSLFRLVVLDPLDGGTRCRSAAQHPMMLTMFKALPTLGEFICYSSIGMPREDDLRQPRFTSSGRQIISITDYSDSDESGDSDSADSDDDDEEEDETPSSTGSGSAVPQPPSSNPLPLLDPISYSVEDDNPSVFSSDSEDSEGNWYDPFDHYIKFWRVGNRIDHQDTGQCWKRIPRWYKGRPEYHGSPLAKMVDAATCPLGKGEVVLGMDHDTWADLGPEWNRTYVRA